MEYINCCTDLFIFRRQKKKIFQRKYLKGGGGNNEETFQTANIKKTTYYGLG